MPSRPRPPPPRRAGPAVKLTKNGQTPFSRSAGAWQRHGFHEDGLHSAHRLAAQILARDPWPESK